MFQNIVFLLVGIAGGYIVLVENSTEKAFRNHGKQCEESIKGIDDLHNLFPSIALVFYRNWINLLMRL